jgi:hypothetical protein
VRLGHSNVCQGSHDVGNKPYLLRWPVTETFIESISTEIVPLRTRSEENAFYGGTIYSRTARSMQALYHFNGWRRPSPAESMREREARSRFISKGFLDKTFTRNFPERVVAPSAPTRLHAYTPTHPHPHPHPHPHYINNCTDTRMRRHTYANTHAHTGKQTRRIRKDTSGTTPQRPQDTRGSTAKLP